MAVPLLVSLIRIIVVVLNILVNQGEKGKALEFLGLAGVVFPVLVLNNKKFRK